MPSRPRSAHEEWQEQVIDLAHIYAWRHLHVRRTVGRGKQWTTATNVKGWPDLFFWHPDRGGFFAAELKILPDKPTDEQEAVLIELRAAGIPAFVWYPDDFEDARRAFMSLRGTLPIFGTVAEAGGGEVRIVVDRDTPRYPPSGSTVAVAATGWPDSGAPLVHSDEPPTWNGHSSRCWGVSGHLFGRKFPHRAPDARAGEGGS